MISRALARFVVQTLNDDIEKTMKTKFLAVLGAFSSLWLANFAAAAITCNISSSGFSATYGTTLPAAAAVEQASYTISCNRNLPSDPLTTTYTVFADNGLNVAAPNGNQGSSGANFLRYDVYRSNSCNLQWRSTAATRLPVTVGTITMTGLATTTVTENYWGCINANIKKPAGTYIDTVTMTPAYSAGVIGGTSTFPVTIVVPPTCTITTGSGALALNYNAFQSLATVATSSLGVTCSNNLPYTMAVSPAIGVLSGVQYALSLPAGNTGNGNERTHVITGTAPANQAGSCSVGPCTETQLTTVTISY